MICTLLVILSPGKFLHEQLFNKMFPLELIHNIQLGVTLFCLKLQINNTLQGVLVTLRSTFSKNYSNHSVAKSATGSCFC